VDRAGRQSSVEELNKEFSATSAAFAIDYRGLKVEEATEFRRKIRESGAKYTVVKNTLARRALEGTPLAALEPHLKGMTGLAVTSTDPAALAKVIHDFAKDVPAVVFKGGVLSARALDESQFKALANLPSREALLSQLLSVLQAPARNLLGVLQAPARDLILVLQAHADKQGGAK
jgi:large subunit ribosomal protein L10